ncbi:hypothetical protein J2T20_001449 [Paenibacillus wynnii]|nr:hypothetical protein [Paenibacillus wynnii]
MKLLNSKTTINIHIDDTTTNGCLNNGQPLISGQTRDLAGIYADGVSCLFFLQRSQINRRIPLFFAFFGKRAAFFNPLYIGGQLTPSKRKTPCRYVKIEGYNQL